MKLSVYDQSLAFAIDAAGDMHDYTGKEIVVEGRIELYKGKPEIKLDDAGQLRR
jgi:DNA/RNA endonuclease YhcR with UshA esterase domain